MRISDWSSDVCSSDLLPAPHTPRQSGVDRALRLPDVYPAGGNTVPVGPSELKRGGNAISAWIARMPGSCRVSRSQALGCRIFLVEKILRPHRKAQAVVVTPDAKARKIGRAHV